MHAAREPKNCIHAPVDLRLRDVSAHAVPAHHQTLGFQHAQGAARDAEQARAERTDALREVAVRDQRLRQAEEAGRAKTPAPISL